MLLEMRGVHIEDTKEKPFFVLTVMQIRFSSQPESGESQPEDVILLVRSHLAILTRFG